MFGKVVKSEFVAPWWAKNRHVQTIWPRIAQRRQQFAPKMQRLTLPDSDFVDLAWSAVPKDPEGMVVLFHGLEGSVKSHYANDMMATLQAQGWASVMMHFRGCSGEPNLTPRAYHSGDTGDALYFLQWLEKQYPGVPKVAVGFSLGANMLLKLLGEHPQQAFLKAAVAVSPPMRLARCADSINHGFSRLYQWYLMNSMTQNLASKMATMDYQGRLRLGDKQPEQLQTFREFDDAVTAPLHGFNDADDYYQRCSSIGFLKSIATPTLILHAMDDPFMDPGVVPTDAELSDSVRCEVSEHGGHVGFMQGSPWRPQVWLHRRIADFAHTFLRQEQAA